MSDEGARDTSGEPSESGDGSSDGGGNASDDGSDGGEPGGTGDDGGTAADEPSGAGDASSTDEPSAAAGGDAGGAATGAGGSIAGTAKGIGGWLVASKLRIALLVLVGLPLLLAVGVGLGYLLGVFGVPEVNGVQNDFGTVTDEETTIETNVSISNPNPVGVSLGGVTIDYGVAMNDVQVANGTKDGVSVGSGNSTMNLETTLFNDRIPPWFASHVRNDERTAVTIDATVDGYGLSRSITQQREIETDILGSFASQQDRPIDANHPLVTDPVLIVEETDAGWGTVSRQETPIEMAFTMYNPNTEPYAISELRYDVTMNDVLVSQGATEDPFVIPGGSRNTLRATTAIQNQRLDEWWVSHLDESQHGHQVSRFRIEFTAVVELPNGQTAVVPLDDLAYEEWITTDLFEEGGDVGVPQEQQSGDGNSDGGTSDGDGSDGTTSDGGSGGNATDGGSDDGSSDDSSSDGGNESDDGDDGGILGAPGTAVADG